MHFRIGFLPNFEIGTEEWTDSAELISVDRTNVKVITSFTVILIIADQSSEAASRKMPKGFVTWTFIFEIIFLCEGGDCAHKPEHREEVFKPGFPNSNATQNNSYPTQNNSYPTQSNSYPTQNKTRHGERRKSLKMLV